MRNQIRRLAAQREKLSDSRWHSTASRRSVAPSRDDRGETQFFRRGVSVFPMKVISMEISIAARFELTLSTSQTASADRRWSVRWFRASGPQLNISKLLEFGFKGAARPRKTNLTPSARALSISMLTEKYAFSSRNTPRLTFVLYAPA